MTARASSRNLAHICKLLSTPYTIPRDIETARPKVPKDHKFGTQTDQGLLPVPSRRRRTVQGPAPSPGPGTGRTAGGAPVAPAAPPRGAVRRGRRGQPPGRGRPVRTGRPPLLLRMRRGGRCSLWTRRARPHDRRRRSRSGLVLLLLLPVAGMISPALPLRRTSGPRPEDEGGIFL